MYFTFKKRTISFMFFKLILISILWTSLSYGQSDDYGIPEKARVIHIPQIHFYSGHKSMYPSEYLDKIQESVVRTQLNIAKIIMNHPNHIYIAEEIPRTLTNNEAGSFTFAYENKKGKTIRMNKDYIEKNIRRNFYKKSYKGLHKGLADIEKELIYRVGSIPLLFFLGHINKVYSATTSPEKFKSIMDKIHPKNDDLSDQDVYNLRTLAREAQLKKHVKSLLKRYPEKKIFIVYGAGHYLSDVFNSKYFYRLPEHFVYPEKYTESLHFAMILLNRSIFRYHYLKKRYGTLAFDIPEEQIIQIRDNFRRVYDILMSYTHGKKPGEISTYYDPEKNKYLTAEELLTKAYKAFDFKLDIETEYAHYKSCQSAFDVNYY